jgi:hypothetical protein
VHMRPKLLAPSPIPIMSCCYQLDHLRLWASPWPITCSISWPPVPPKGLARHTIWNISLDTAMRCSYTRVIRLFFATAIIFSGAGPEGKGKTSMSPGRTTFVNTLSAMACLPGRSRFLVRPQRLTRRSPLPIGRGLSHFTTDFA